VSAVASSAAVPTDRAGRYAKQLSTHLGRRLETSWDEGTGTGSIRFDVGECALTATPGALVMEIALVDEPPDPAGSLDRMEDVVGRHLVRFGTRDELVVQWQRADGSPGSNYSLET
jgi:hypothetical protein